MENLDLIALKSKAHSARVAIHMAGALPTGLATRAQRRRVQNIWRIWMTLATLALASAGIAVLVMAILRHGL